MSPRFGILLGAMLVSVGFIIVDILVSELRHGYVALLRDELLSDGVIDAIAGPLRMH